MRLTSPISLSFPQQSTRRQKMFDNEPDDDQIEEPMDYTPMPSREHVAALERKLADAMLLAEQWMRSGEHNVRIMGADLKQVLEA